MGPTDDDHVAVVGDGGEGRPFRAHLAPVPAHALRTQIGQGDLALVRSRLVHVNAWSGVHNHRCRISRHESDEEGCDLSFAWVMIFFRPHL